MGEHFDFDKMYCGAVRRGDVFLYETDKGEERAVAVLQDNVLNDGLPTVVGAAIEPQAKGEKVFANEVLLHSEETGLGKDGICMLHKVYTIERQRLVAKKGELQVARLQEIYKALDVNLGRFRDG